MTEPQLVVPLRAYDEAMPTAHPYAAPGSSFVYRTNVNVPPGATSRAPVGPLLNRLRLVFGTAHVVIGIVAFGGMVAGAIGGNMELLWNSSLGIWASLALFFAWALVDVLWVYRFWNWIPPQHRYTSLWRSYISPRVACGFLLCLSSASSGCSPSTSATTRSWNASGSRRPAPSRR